MKPKRLANRQVDALYRAHAAGLRRFLFGVLRSAESVEEALQRTFVELVEKGQEAQPETMKGWIYKVAFHQAIALKRRAGARPDQTFDVSHLDALGAVDLPVDERAAAAERIEQLRSAVAALPEPQREVLQLRMFEHLGFQQIADRVGVPLGTALTRMRLALDKLRKQLREDDDGEER